MCVTVKRSLALRLRNFFFGPCSSSSFSTFPQFSNFVRSFFLCPINIYWAAARARCLRSSKGLVTVLTWLLVRRISLSNQHHLSALDSKLGHTHTHRRRIKAKEETAENGLKTKEKQPSSVWGNRKRKRENRKPKTKTNVKPLIYLLAIS